MTITQPGPVATWLFAARPKTLLASVAPVTIGVAMAVSDRVFHVGSALAALLGALLLQIGTNFCNDYCDFIKGADTENREGPTRAVQAGLVTPQAMLRATVIVFLAAGMLATYLVSRAGFPILVIGVVSIACGVFYTAGPYPLAYVGLGDFFVLVFFGPVAVAGTYFVQAVAVPPAAVIVAGLAPGLISVALLTVNNLRDIDEDRVAGKRTLTVRFGAQFARIEYAACIGLAALIPVVLVPWQSRGAYSLIAVLVLIPAIPTIRRVFSESGGTGLNPALGQTARLLMIYSIIFSIGWIV
jgi:1,4-dihydroxy-2-naphthoate octaprenyltransferase